MSVTPEQLAKRFHELYEKLALEFQYTTRKESAKPWEDVPKANNNLMIEVCRNIIKEFM